MNRLTRPLILGTARGLLAGAAGIIAMDALWYRRYRASGGTSSPLNWEFRSAAAGFDEAPAPAKVGKRLADTINVTLPDSLVGATNNVVHWATGLSWGVAAVAVQVIPGVRPLKAGLVTGVAAFATSYAVLPKLDIYEPITQYDTPTLAKDLSAHLAFGAAAGLVSMIVRPVLRRRR
jgi:hypothetical protein